MFKVNLVAVGKIKEKFYTDAFNEYKKRLARFCEFTVYECKEESLEGVAPAVALKKECDEILPLLRGKVIALCVEGRQFSSEDFAEKLKETKDTAGEITFVIGSSCGLDERVKNRADLKLSFSKMTFPHMLFRVMLAEQIYRCFMINGGGKYHK
ncbi:MAG: 23S rRNA (pseudouridine(1915)-N(3))-methyltransferase RlmH [Candidatus Borkfalkiaceae bacterium]|nr:23S rRNA (pseudouridine(1915)-N(3))-methyltransferase RlmH [Christensenellaceae bacterium]